MPASLAPTQLDRFLSDVGGEIVAESRTHRLARLDADTFVAVGRGPVSGAWLADSLPAGRGWWTEWMDQDGEDLWTYVTADVTAATAA